MLLWESKQGQKQQFHTHPSAIATNRIQFCHGPSCASPWFVVFLLHFSSSCSLVSVFVLSGFVYVYNCGILFLHCCQFTCTQVSTAQKSHFFVYITKQKKRGGKKHIIEHLDNRQPSAVLYMFSFAINDQLKPYKLSTKKWRKLGSLSWSFLCYNSPWQ